MKRFRKTCLFLLVLATNFVAWQPAALADPPPEEIAYQKARRAFYRFKADKKRQKYRHNWQNVAKLFERVADRWPDTSRAADALFTAGKLYLDLYEISRVGADLEKALELFGRLVEHFPRNHLADDAQLYVATAWLEYLKQPERARQELAFLVNTFPRGDVTPRARRMLEDLGGEVALPASKAARGRVGKRKAGSGPSAKKTPNRTVAKTGGEKADGRGPVLEAVKYWSNPDYTRIALYTRTKVRYRVGRLPADRKRRRPGRLYVDLLGCDLGEDVPALTSVKDGLVRSIRAAEKDTDTVRVVFDCGRPFTQKVVPLENPDRILVDISRVENPSKVAKAGKRVGGRSTKAPDKRLVAKIKRASKPKVSLSVMAGLKVKRIVIDPGHGGRDPGAIGPSRTFEKKITLDIARRLKRLLSEKSGLEVLLTRNSDKFVPLEERTAFANEHRGDLFVSIHLNAHANRKMRGVETFYLDITDDRYSIRLAARENATSEKTISDLRYILADLATKSNTDDAIHLARVVQRALVGRLRQGWKGIKSLGVKPALFYVLIGARMPAILVEASFITNPTEEKRLRRASYRQAIAEGIWRGIMSFIKEREKVYASGG